jgi:hypothetical protein
VRSFTTLTLQDQRVGGGAPIVTVADRFALIACDLERLLDSGMIVEDAAEADELGAFDGFVWFGAEDGEAAVPFVFGREVGDGFDRCAVEDLGVARSPKVRRGSPSSPCSRCGADAKLVASAQVAGRVADPKIGGVVHSAP